MNSKIPFASMRGVGRLRFWLPLLALLLCGSAFATECVPPAEYQDIDMANCRDPMPRNCPSPITPGALERCFAAQRAVSSATQEIAACNPFCAGNVAWTPTPHSGCSDGGVMGGFHTFTCAGMTVKVPDGSVGLSSKATITIPAVPNTGDSSIDLRVSQICGPATRSCTQHYRLRVTENGGGWGDPHIDTVDGVHYDFQSAGEFTALRGKGLEIQTRQTPIATTFLPGANPYTGLKTCVAIYSAVAARVGKHRVTYQPNISGVPDPSGLQLRVDGKLRKLGPEGIDLEAEDYTKDHTKDYTKDQIEDYTKDQTEDYTKDYTKDQTEDYTKDYTKDQTKDYTKDQTKDHTKDHRPASAGRIVQSPAGGGIEIHYADGTKLVVTPAYWPDQQKWYLNVNIYGWGTTTATKGIMGLVADGWLPKLPNDSSLGPRPGPLHDRYVQLYKTFADEWRVTDYTSLFDYAKGTSTKTFTNRDWPKEDPSSCTIEGEPTAQPLPRDVAEKRCSAVVDKNNKDNCIFDVRVTGNPGFAQTYELSEQLQPGLTETTVKDDKDPTKVGENVTFTATVLPRLARGGGVPGGAVQFFLDGSKFRDPVTLDTLGRAALSTSKLEAGEHKVVANYIPTGFGGVSLPSSSPKLCHTVEAGYEPPPTGPNVKPPPSGPNVKPPPSGPKVKPPPSGPHVN